MTEPTAGDRIERARGAQRKWAALSLRERCRSLKLLRHQIAAQSADIVEILSGETGKPPLDALSGDILVTLEQLRYYEAHAEGLLKARKIGKPSFLYPGVRFEESFEPHGAVLIYSPMNYPFQLSVVPMATALFAGNAVILKCSEKTPRMAQLLDGLCRDANLPENLVQVVCDEPESAAALIDAGPDMVFFTGSSENGRQVAARAASHLIPAVLELGGKDACLVFGDCNFERAIEGVTYGAFSNAGQVCVGVKRLYIERAIFPAFVGALTARARTLRIGSTRHSDLGVLHGDGARIRFIQQVEDALRRGATLHLPQRESLAECGPVILSNVPADARLMVEESFGPVVCAAPFRDEAEAIGFANASAFALSCSVWTGDRARGERVATQMSAGSCAVNDVIRNIANPHASFGGNRSSGHGRYHGPQGLYAFSRSKSVMIARGRSQRERNWFPFTQQTFSLLQKIIAFRHEQANIFRRIWRLFFAAILFVSVMPVFAGEADHTAHLHIEVKPPANSHGAIAYLIFASKDGFPNTKEKAMRGGFVPASDSQKPQVSIDAGEIPPGRYAVTVYQDVNGNRMLDKNFLGIPKEPVGASNNPKPRKGPPRFDDCAFQVGRSDETISIVLVR